MKVIRKSKRLSIYKKMLEYYNSPEIENHLYMGFCYTMQALDPEFDGDTLIDGRSDYYFYGSEFQPRFPELHKYKPKNKKGCSYWFNINNEGIEMRREILCTIIKEMSK